MHLSQNTLFKHVNVEMSLVRPVFVCLCGCGVSSGYVSSSHCFAVILIRAFDFLVAAAAARLNNFLTGKHPVWCFKKPFVKEFADPWFQSLQQNSGVSLSNSLKCCCVCHQHLILSLKMEDLFKQVEEASPPALLFFSWSTTCQSCRRRSTNKWYSCAKLGLWPQSNQGLPQCNSSEELIITFWPLELTL